MRFGPWTLAAVACAGVLASCGGDDEGANEKRYAGAEKEVAAMIDKLQKASRDEKPETICGEIFAKDFRVQLERQTRSSCEQRVTEQLVAKDAKFTVKRISVDNGKSAVVNVTDQRGTKSVLYFTKGGDGWRLIQIAR